MIHTEHFTNHRAFGLGSVRVQNMRRPLNRREQLQEAQKQICLRCEYINCKGSCDKLILITERTLNSRKLLKLSLETVTEGVATWSEEEKDNFFSKFWKKAILK